MTVLNKLWQNIVKRSYMKNISYVIIFSVLSFLLINITLVYLEFQATSVDPIKVIGLTFIILICCFILGIFLINTRVASIFSFIKHGKKRASKLRKRIIIAFSLGASVPTIIVAIFSTYFFYFGVQAWFDDKISRVLDQSITVGRSYIDEHVLQLKDTAISISKDLGSVYYDLIRNPNPNSFREFIAAQAEIRSLDEIIVFQKDNNTVLAQTSLSFSLAFLTIPAYVFERVNKGEIVQISSDPSKIRVLIKLRDYKDTYLLIGRLVDAKIADYINKSSGAAQEYYRLKKHILDLQLKFSMIFVLLAITLLLAAITWGRHFAERIVKPIRELVIAAEKVKNGDYSAQVPELGLKKDEIKILSSAFNRMVKQIDRGQRDLAIAQRALAWSDVARRVAHEIKNPLTPIQLSAERLLKKFSQEVKDKESFEKYVNNITKHSNDIKRIVSEFVNFARLPSPQLAKTELVSMINYLIDARRLINDDIVYEVSSNVNPLEFVCDSSQINQIMVNLLQNSEDAFETKNQRKKISVNIAVEGDFVCVSILDNGPGFDSTIIENATKSYVTTKIKGMGLGLAIVERITEDHFGTLHVFNREEGGAAIKLTFNAKELKSKLK